MTALQMDNADNYVLSKKEIMKEFVEIKQHELLMTTKTGVNGNERHFMQQAQAIATRDFKSYL